MRTHDLPQEFIQIINGAFAEKAEKWLADLPKLVDQIAAEWSLKAGKPFANLSYHYVARCVCADGNEAVIKIGFPGEHGEFISQVKTLRIYNGEGAVTLLQVDEDRCAMLLEKLTPGENLGNLCLKDDAEAVEIAVGILKRIVRPAPENDDLHLLDDWINKFNYASNTEFSSAAINKAQNFYRELSAGTERKFLLHGDFHHENILSAERGPFLVIDSKGLIGNIGYDIGVFLNNHRNWLKNSANRQEKLTQSVNRFSEAFGIDEEDVRKWAYIQKVLSAWWTFEENGESWKRELSRAEVWRV